MLGIKEVSSLGCHMTWKWVLCAGDSRYARGDRFPVNRRVYGKRVNGKPVTVPLIFRVIHSEGLLKSKRWGEAVKLSGSSYFVRGLDIYAHP